MNTVYEALAHPTRRAVVALLRDGDLTAGELADRLGVAKPTLSGHLNVLKSADLIHGDRNGTSISYHLHMSVLEDSLSWLLDLLGVQIGVQNGDSEQPSRHPERPGDAEEGHDDVERSD